MPAYSLDGLDVGYDGGYDSSYPVLDGEGSLEDLPALGGSDVVEEVAVFPTEELLGYLERFERTSDAVYLFLMVVPAMFALSLLYKFFRELVT